MRSGKLRFFAIILFVSLITSYELSLDKLGTFLRGALSGVEVPVTSYYAYAQDKIAAVVNDAAITQKDLNDFITFMRIQLSGEMQGEQLERKIVSMKSDLLNRLIEDRLILQEAKKSGVKVDSNRVKAKLDQIRARFATEAEFQESLTRQGLTLSDIEVRIKDQLLMYEVIESKVRSRITVNPVEVTDFYDKNIDEFRLAQERKLEVMITEDKNLANQIYDSLKAGTDIRQLAEKHKISLNNLAVVRNGQLRKDIEDMVFSMSVGEASKPVKIEDKHYVFKLTGITPARLQSLSEVKDAVYELLANMKMQEELTKWLDGLRKQSYIKVFAD